MRCSGNSDVKVAQQVLTISKLLVIDSQQTKIRNLPVRRRQIASRFKNLVRWRKKTDLRLTRLFIRPWHHNVRRQVVGFTSLDLRHNTADVRHFDRATRSFSRINVLRTLGVRIANSGRWLSHATNQRQSICIRSSSLQQFGELNSRYRCRNGLEGTSVITCRFGLRIPSVDMRHPSLLEDHQYIPCTSRLGGSNQVLRKERSYPKGAETQKTSTSKSRLRSASCVIVNGIRPTFSYGTARRIKCIQL